jgi:hypothetical protein
MDYKLYFLDPEGHIRQRVDIDCEDDERAIRTVAERATGEAMELWEGARLVKKFERSGRPKA